MCSSPPKYKTYIFTFVCVRQPVVSTQISVHLDIISGADIDLIRLFLLKSLCRLEDIATVSESLSPSGIVTTTNAIQKIRWFTISCTCS